MPAGPVPQLTPDGKPTMTVSQRRKFFDECRFVDVRNLVYMEYKKPDQTPLMSYEQTLDDRDRVKEAALQYEYANGWLLQDGDVQQQMFQPDTQQGVPQMTSQYQPVPNGAPVQQAPQQLPFAPAQQQIPAMVAPQPQVPQYAPAPTPVNTQPVASPQQVAAVGAAPQQQDMPATMPTGRKRGRPAGTSVAPPPAAPPPTPQQQQTFAQPQTFTQPTTGYAPQQPVPMQQFQPQAPIAATPQQPAFQPQQAQQTAAVAPVQVDLTPVVQRQDATAKMIETLGSQINNLAAGFAEQRNFSLQLLTMMHHMYLVTPALQPQQQPGQPAPTPLPRTLPEFQAWLQKFIGVPQ